VQIVEELEPYVEVCHWNDMKHLIKKDFFIYQNGEFLRVKTIIPKENSFLIITDDGGYQLFGEYSKKYYILAKYVQEFMPEELL